MLRNLRNAAQVVTDALNNLLQHIHEGSRVLPVGEYDNACDDILNVTDKLFNSTGNAEEMVKQAKFLAEVLVLIIYKLSAELRFSDQFVLSITPEKKSKNQRLSYAFSRCRKEILTWNGLTYIWVKAFKYGPNKMFGRQPLKDLK